MKDSVKQSRQFARTSSNTAFTAHFDRPNSALPNFFYIENVRRNMSIVDIRDENRE